ncbi:hypothetical protein V2W45_1252370, partial [Cenococcum geophilum]
DLSYWSRDAIEFLSIIMDTRPKELILYPFLKQAKALNLAWFTIYTLRNAYSFIKPIKEGVL